MALVQETRRRLAARQSRWNLLESITVVFLKNLLESTRLLESRLVVECDAERLLSA